MDPQVSSISNRMSLRPPLTESLALLDQICGLVKLDKSQPVPEALKAIQERFPQVKDFERDFPSLCFYIATGVGKTRLMGAFIAYLYKTKGIRHFFILAPNLTIYNKLIGDLTPGSPKYVLQGLAEFATNPPEVITGDNYESGRAVRDEVNRQKHLGQESEAVHINIFNISKINSEVRGGRAPRIKRLSEYIGQSYFDYLSGLDDLVLLMDESHRYRASAGLRVLNELHPVIGLELTATAQTMSGAKATPFKNVLYRYTLASAMKDGFVKEPAVATRKDFDVKKIQGEELDRIKLEDGLLIHENAKLKLEAYAAENGVNKVKPFVLVIARNTAHADQIAKIVGSDLFHGGRYKGKVLTIHTNLEGAIEDENLETLLSVEHPDNPVEVVVHVNKLGEGWDVTNLYTIIPLRAADSRTLVEQSIGRGLRLPYGKRTGNPDVDRLTIVAHDKFQEIVEYARKEDSIIRQVFVGEDIPSTEQLRVEVQPKLDRVLSGAEPAPAGITFADAEERAIASAVNRAMDSEGPALVTGPRPPEVELRAKIVARAAQTLPAGMDTAKIERVVPKVEQVRGFLTIQVPHILVQPKGEVTVRYEDFGLDTSGMNYRAVDQEVLLKHLENDKEFRLRLDAVGVTEERPEDHLVHGLVDYNDIDYERDRDLLYTLSGQVVEHLKANHLDEQGVLNVLQFYRRPLVESIHDQMSAHMIQSAEEWEVTVREQVSTLRGRVFGRDPKEPVRDFRQPVPDKRSITKYVFNGFVHCLFDAMKFQSDPERVFAMILDRDTEKWVKPSKQEFPIYYREGTYVPDFVAETSDSKFVCEVKRVSEIHDATVIRKATALYEWSQHANEVERKSGGKPWKCLLVPDDAFDEASTLEGLVAKFAYEPPKKIEGSKS
ncbi:MAG: DEAD/DEAH box helicase family protein [Nitrososphaerota archaeon]|nr:DEAD/DEAH box helicase family protein [Nitrososphaerota archaeon]